MLKQWRKSLGLTQEQAGYLLGLGRVHMCRLERGLYEMTIVTGILMSAIKVAVDNGVRIGDLLEIAESEWRNCRETTQIVLMLHLIGNKSVGLKRMREIVEMHLT
jgi:DNA-binding XRE family transcriptional regulator